MVVWTNRLDICLQRPWKAFFRTAKVIEDYSTDPPNPIMLTIQKGQHIIIVDKVGDASEWWKGRYHNEVKNRIIYWSVVYSNNCILLSIFSRRDIFPKHLWRKTLSFRDSHHFWSMSESATSSAHVYQRNSWKSNHWRCDTRCCRIFLQFSSEAVSPIFAISFSSFSLQISAKSVHIRD